MSNDNYTVKQHYVPRFYLDRFNDLDDKLWIYDIRSDKKYSARAKDICYKKDLYEVKWENASTDLGEYVFRNDIEKEFSLIEHEGAILFAKLDKIITNNQNPNASICINGEKEIFFSIIANLLYRNPKTLEEYKITEIEDEFLNEFDLKSLCDLLDEIGLGGGESIIRMAKKRALLLEDDGSPISNFIAGLKLLPFEFLYAKDGSFITSDIPVSYGNDSTIKASNKECLYFPISSKIAVLFGNYGFKKNKMIPINKNIVDDFNRAYIGIGEIKKNLIICNNEKQRDELVAYIRNNV